MDQKTLSKRLLLLPLDLHDKVRLWLAYRGLKPVSEISAVRRQNARRLLKTSPFTYKHNLKRIKNWIRDAGLSYTAEVKHPSSWHVGKDKDKTRLSTKIIYRSGYENAYLSGLLFGFPEKSVKAYAYNRDVKLGENQRIMIWPGHKYLHPFLKDKYFTPYITYAILADRVKEDCRIAQAWADIIRADVPTLSRWFEKSVSNRRKKESIFDLKLKKRIERDNQSPPVIISEYYRSSTNTEGVLRKAVQEFTDDLLSEFHFASVCYHITKRASASERKDKLLMTTLELGMRLHNPARRADSLAGIRISRQLIDWYNRR